MNTEKQYDFIILGSGSSGGMAGYWLQKAGAKCLMLEAGRHFTDKDFPLPEMEYSSQLYWGGGLEYNTRCNLAFLRGRCVGGGSVVNQALMDRFDEVAFSDWRAASGVSWLNEQDLDADYDAAEAQLVLQEIKDEHRNNNANLFLKGMENLGYTWKPLRRGQSDCGTDEGNDCIACLGGCHRRSKQSTVFTTIPRAMELGMQLESDCQVERIEHQADGVVVHANQHGQERTWRAGKVILACGTLGTNQLLLKSGFEKKLPALGKGFSMHPQFMNLAVFDEPVDAHKGAFQGVKSMDDSFRARGFKLENVFAPPISIGVLYQRVGTALQNFMHKYRHFACIEVAVRDENTGTIRINKKGRLQVEKSMTDQDWRRANDGRDVVKQIFESLGAKHVELCNWSFGLHLMGGCAIGNDAKHSVVGPDFQVHDHANLYCADGAIFPNAPGINPALSIMALTHRMCAQLAR
jgi:choline dehydrogenase-like flavoprotein